MSLKWLSVIGFSRQPARYPTARPSASRATKRLLRCFSMYRPSESLETLAFLLDWKNHAWRSTEKNVVYVAKTRGEIGDFVCPLYFHHHPRRPTDRSRWRRPSKARERLSRFVYHNLVSRTGFPEHRSGQAPASHPRVSEAAACLHIGGAGAIPDGVAD